jgi:hypothetical protein
VAPHNLMLLYESIPLYFHFNFSGNLRHTWSGPQQHHRSGTL